MDRASGRRTWIKLYCWGRLHGSVVYQLTEAEQSVWDKLLCYAGIIGRSGQISDNDGRAFPHSFIAYELHTTEELLGSTLEKCKAEGRITENDQGIFLVNWTNYQSEYNRQKPYRERAKEQGEDPLIQPLNSNVAEIFSAWNSHNIIVHRKPTDEIKRAISGKLQSYGVAEICQAISNYAEILKGAEYWFKYRWTLKDFLRRGFDKFFDIEIARKNYKQDGWVKGHNGTTREYTEPADFRAERAAQEDQG